MIISWNWLKEYVLLDMPSEELETRLMMAGLNHESTSEVGGDLAIDLEVTSNRPDCLGHLGIAREVAVLFARELKLPPAEPTTGSARVADLAKVVVESPALCPRYTARVIQGVKVGPSPAWLSRRLNTVGIASINNVVDVTNYVLMESGQPLHAFDLSKLDQRQIVVRAARAGEKLIAIDHKTYELAAGMCVIADASRPVALGGVMGGAESEVTAATKDLLIESAEFDPSSIRATARALNLHSPSSYRFERGLDPAGVEWASRRACQLILEVAGGTLASGVLDVGRAAAACQPVVLRLSQIERVLGIKIPVQTVRSILASLGNEETLESRGRAILDSYADQSSNAIEVIPPTWRRDLTREIDLIEEVARIHGYDAIPEDVSVPMAPSARTAVDRVLSRVRHVLTAAGFDEALTVSLVDEDWSSAFSPWTEQPPLVSQMAVLRRADRLRRSLIPSLLGARRTNETLNNPIIELFEVAKVYLPQPGALPREDLMLGMTSGGDFLEVKGVIEALFAELHAATDFDVQDTQHALFQAGHACQLLMNGQVFGVLGELSAAGQKRFDLRGKSTVAEIKLQALLDAANVIPTYERQPAFPGITRDLNFTVQESVRWSELAATVRASAGPLLESVQYQDTYRDTARVGEGKKRLLLSVTLRQPEGTLTGQQADAACAQIIHACREQLAAELVG